MPEKVRGFQIAIPKEGVSMWPEGPEELAGWERRDLIAEGINPDSVYVTYGGEYLTVEVTTELSAVWFAYNLGERWFEGSAPAHVTVDGKLIIDEEWFEEHCL